MLSRLELDTLFHPLPRLETERLVLEPARMAHADALFQIFSDPAVSSPSDEEPDASIDATVNRVASALKRSEARTGISWVLVLKSEECVVGHVTLHSISWSHRRGELGFSVAPRLWRRGLMSEALREVIRFSFSELRFIKLCAQNSLHNDSCHALLLGLGFEQEAVLRQHGFWNDKAHDVRQYGLFATPNAPSRLVEPA